MRVGIELPTLILKSSPVAVSWRFGHDHGLGNRSGSVHISGSRCVPAQGNRLRFLDRSLVAGTNGYKVSVPGSVEDADLGTAQFTIIETHIIQVTDDWLPPPVERPK